MRRSAFRILSASILIIAIAGIVACVRQPRPDDAGDYAFARQVIPKLYGRKAKGYAEVKLVGDLSATFGRETTLRALMAQPEFAEHWSEVLVDRMRINRTGPKSQGSCFPETLTAAADNPDLAAWIRDHAASASGSAVCSGGSCGNFTLSDVLRSSIRLDDLSPAYRAYLFPLIDKTNPAGSVEAVRSDLFSNFETVYLGRRNTCLGCHNSAWSMSGPQSYWNRTHPILGLPELAVYGANIGRLPRELESMMRTDAASGSHHPWGLSSSCGSYNASVLDDGLLAPSEVAFLSGAHGRRGTVFDIDRHLREGVNKIAADGVQRFTSPQTTAACSVCGTCTGTTEPSPDPAQMARETAAGAILGSTRCTNCHASGSGSLVMTAGNWKGNLIRTASTSSTMPRVRPGDAGNSYLMTKLRACNTTVCPPSGDDNRAADGSGRMPASGPKLNSAELATIEAWINGMPTESGCSTCQANRTQGMCDGIRREMDPDEALAMLVGANTVNTVWTEVMGYPLPIDNGFPRNADQKGVLWYLTEYNFLNKHWSLQELLVKIYGFRFYNRLPPSANTGTTGYEIAMLFDPWVEGDPRVPPQAVDGWTPGGPAPTPDSSYSAAAHPERHNNAMTEAVHRYSANTLLNSVSRSLAWPKPKRFPDASYPSATLAGSIGQFIKDAEPGFRGTDMQGLLNWEASVGQCAKPPGTGSDWIDALLAARASYDAAHPADPITVRDFAQTMRDWLINDSELGTTAATGTSDPETQLLANLFGVGALNVSAATVTDLPGKARRYCGVLLKSPQFMLAGIAPTGLGNKPKLQVCNPGDDCHYQAMCTALAPALRNLTSHLRILCGTDSVGYIPRLIFDLPILVELFPKKWLWGIEKLCLSAACQVIDKPVLDNPRELSRQITPQITARSGIAAMPMDLPHKLRDGAVLAIGWAGQSVSSAEDVTLRRGDKEQPLAKRELLADGDLLIFSPKAGLKVGEHTLQAPAVAFKHLAQRKGLKGSAATSPLIVYVVNKDRLELPASDHYAMKPPIPLIEQIQEAEWLLHGSAGRLRGPIDPRARQDTPERQGYWQEQRKRPAQTNDTKPMEPRKP